MALDTNTSLSLLLPSPCQRTACLQTADARFSRTSTTSELEALTRTVIDGINSRSYRTIHSLVASSYKADLDDITQSNSYDENVTQFIDVSSRNPEYRIEVADVDADVDEESGYAIVYALLSVTGRPANVRRQSVSIVEWMRRGGQWQFYKATLMRGQDGTDIAHPGCTRCARAALRRDSAIVRP